MRQERAIKNARGVIIGALEERFQIAAVNIIDKVKSIDREEILDSLFKQALRCSNMDGFNAVLSKATQ